MELLVTGVIPTKHVKTDGGRSTSKRPKQRYDCTVRALAEVTGISYDEAYDYLKDAGRKCSRSFGFKNHIEHYAKTGKTLFGYRIKKHSFPAVKGQERMYVGAFLIYYPEGRFVISQAKHVSAVIDGYVYDLDWDCYRCVYAAYQFVKD